MRFFIAITVACCVANAVLAEDDTNQADVTSQGRSDVGEGNNLTPDEQRDAELEKRLRLEWLSEDLKTAESNQKAAIRSRNRQAIEKAKDELSSARKSLNTARRLTDTEWLASRRQRLANEANAAQQAKEIKSTRPLSFKGAVLRRNVISLPELWVTMVNNTDIHIEAYTITAECFTKFDEPVRAINGSTTFAGMSQTKIAPKADETSHWQMSLYRSTGYVNVWVSRIKYANGTEWTQTRDEAAQRGNNLRRVNLSN